MLNTESLNDVHQLASMTIKWLFFSREVLFSFTPPAALLPTRHVPSQKTMRTNSDRAKQIVLPELSHQRNINSHPQKHKLPSHPYCSRMRQSQKGKLCYPGGILFRRDAEMVSCVGDRLKWMKFLSDLSWWGGAVAQYYGVHLYSEVTRLTSVSFWRKTNFFYFFFILKHSIVGFYLKFKNTNLASYSIITVMSSAKWVETCFLGVLNNGENTIKLTTRSHCKSCCMIYLNMLFP